jgi:hypothetical protein
MLRTEVAAVLTGQFSFRQAAKTRAEKAICEGPRWSRYDVVTSTARHTGGVYSHPLSMRGACQVVHSAVPLRANVREPGRVGD